MRAASAAGATLFVQAAAGTALLSMASATLRAAGSPPSATIALGTTDGEDDTQFLDALCELAVLGVPVKLAPLFESPRSTWLPPTPLPTEPYWCAVKSDRERAPLPALGTVATTAPDAAMFAKQAQLLAQHAE